MLSNHDLKTFEVKLKSEVGIRMPYLKIIYAKYSKSCTFTMRLRSFVK